MVSADHAITPTLTLHIIGYGTFLLSEPERVISSRVDSYLTHNPALPLN
jgi:hypothetical protein